VLGASETTVGAWRALGLRGLEIGDEAVLDPADFTLSSRRMRNVRQAVSRSANAGIDIHIGAFDAATADELGLVLQDWLGGRKLRGFSMNLDQVLSPHPDVVIATARSADGELVAFARFLRGADGQVLTLDVAPRRRDAPNGTVERLVVAVVEHARSLGVREVSLNFAGLRRVLESDAASARVAMALARGLDRWIDVRRLYQFSAKFQPAWRTRSLLMGSWLAVGTAAFLAELRPTTPPGPENGPTDAPAADAAPAPVPPL
jgi:lysyl-tRNA synthetase class 2